MRISEPLLGYPIRNINIIFILLFMGIFVIALCIPNEVKIHAFMKDFSFIESEIVQDQNEFYHIIGLLKNTGNRTIDNSIVTGTIMDKQNNVITNYSSQIDVQPLSPNNIAPFDILIYNREYNDKIQNYSLDIKFGISKTKQQDLRILNAESKLDINGFYYITGRVQNYGDNISNSTTVIASTFDNNNKIIGVWKAQTEPYNISPGKIASFTIPVTDKTQSFRINNFTLYFNGI